MGWEVNPIPQRFESNLKMPAVDPARLRKQIAGLMRYFGDAEAFHQHTSDLFSRYANWVLKLGDDVQPEAQMPTYHLSPPVMRLFQQDLKAFCLEDTTQALFVADELWSDSYYEVQLIAIHILHILPLNNVEPFYNRLEKWISPQQDRAINEKLWVVAAEKLQHKFQDQWEKLIQKYLDHSDEEMINLGILGLSMGIRQSGFTNLPAIFRLISPLIQAPSSSIRQSLMDLLKVLIEISPTETSVFLKQNFSVDPTPDALLLLKNCIPYFPETYQKNLSYLLKRQN